MFGLVFVVTVMLLMTELVLGIGPGAFPSCERVNGVYSALETQLRAASSRQRCLFVNAHLVQPQAYTALCTTYYAAYLCRQLN